MIKQKDFNPYRKNINFTDGESRQTVNIADNFIEKGIFRKLNGLEFKVFIYLITHREQQSEAVIEIPRTAAALGLKISQLKYALSELEDKSIISEGGEKTRSLKTYFIHLDVLLSAEPQPKKEDDVPQHKGRELRKEIIRSNKVSKNEIAAAIISFIPPDSRSRYRRDEINGWLEDFELKMLKELVRRVDKWMDRQGGSDYMQGAYAYLRAIIQSWYEDEITSYEELQEQDRLHRETKELAQAYGIRRSDLNTAQLKTFLNWITGSQALSKDLALAAIREAVRRKRDGQPSLKYIEDNFINPIKELGIKNRAEFKRWLEKEMNSSPAQNSGNNNSGSSKTKKDSTDEAEEYKWKDFFIDFDKYKK
ncbi:DnaD domain protein [Halanaerobium sp. MA284_MarDTE_T2]|uniref:DnaD domain protein n=1 Tax=Halanaerobium sp. MA284_MarDTE_T2 TaxID=2183913 RepID=UPI000DF29184|nr:DnaD domain protein [Halanaerobium sp. MA284_MarDTE_T2]RCW44121.1 replication initiation and membrane attachment protein [Halanaerobium sp. MA284_MarDTE_T2]